MSNDSEYDDMVRAEKKAARELKKAHYRLTDNPRCENCKHFIPGTWTEDPNLCGRVHESQRWIVGIVSTMGICDSWGRAKNESAAAPDLADVAHMVLNTATVYTPQELVKAATEALRKAGEIP